MRVLFTVLLAGAASLALRMKTPASKGNALCRKVSSKCMPVKSTAVAAQAACTTFKIGKQKLPH